MQIPFAMSEIRGRGEDLWVFKEGPPTQYPWLELQEMAALSSSSCPRDMRQWESK